MIVTKKKYVLVGTGGRGVGMFARPLLTTHAASADLVGVYDPNPKRMEGAQAWLGRQLPTFNDFDKMLADTQPDCVVVASRDCTHADYVVRGLKAGKRVYVEKPLCTTARACRDILAAARQSNNLCLVTHNMRYDLACISIRSLVQQERIGKLLFVQFEETLDRSHGADYFRRWHRNLANSGGLQIHKASHHFDMLNWWIGSRPATVRAQGGLRVYGKNSPYRGRCCRDCAHTAQCPFFVDYSKIDVYKKLYFEAEQVDGYLRDGCVFDPSIDIQDQLAVHIRYENGVDVNYSLVAHAAYEGMNVTMDGTLGRLEHTSSYIPSEQAALGLIAGEKQRVIVPGYPVLDVPINRGDGDHGGADPSLRADFFDRDWSLKPNSQMASVDQAVQAVLIGVAITKSLQTGTTVNVQDLLNHD